jgi:hypothetical protein
LGTAGGTQAGAYAAWLPKSATAPATPFSWSAITDVAARGDTGATIAEIG